MKQIVAVVKPFLAEKLISTVADMEVEEISIREVKGYGRQKNYLDQYGENEYSLAFVPKVEISVWLNDQKVESVLEKMSEVARTGRLGDGKFFVMPVSDNMALFQGQQNWNSVAMIATDLLSIGNSSQYLGPP